MGIVIIILLIWMICGLLTSYIHIIKTEPKESRSPLIYQLLMLLAIGPFILVSVLLEKKDVDV